MLCLIASEAALHRYSFDLEAHLVIEMNIGDDGIPELVKQRLSIAVEVIQRRQAQHTIFCFTSDIFLPRALGELRQQVRHRINEPSFRQSHAAYGDTI
ncbi:hypothetical protein RT97_02195 [Variovorax paradoxus]|uniref:Uncharacterized protein n=1 Tax=Variovorax paradoxus TaxID=34073 RepID=A0A0D0MUH6_VARPD|nr:hypothetical protein RT97_02195 [Variovorax paradoxus]